MEVEVGTKTSEDTGKPVEKADFMFLEKSDDNEEEQAGVMSVDNELESYLKEPRLKEDLNPLTDFWKKKHGPFSRLSELAKKYLCIQATSTTSETVFSNINNVVSQKRTSLTSSHTNETISLSKVL